jgi:hypothetical protein
MYLVFLSCFVAQQATHEALLQVTGLATVELLTVRTAATSGAAAINIIKKGIGQALGVDTRIGLGEVPLRWLMHIATCTHA